jgi:hypothetical protein
MQGRHHLTGARHAAQDGTRRHHLRNGSVVGQVDVNHICGGLSGSAVGVLGAKRAGSASIPDLSGALLRSIAQKQIKRR